MPSAPTVLLVVEDDRDIREALVEILEESGLEVESCKDGVEALERLDRGPLPDLLLLDLMMPRLDGFGVLAEMKKNAALSAVPVVVLSASTDLPRALQAGARSTLRKPIDIDRLMHEIERSLPGSGAC